MTIGIAIPTYSGHLYNLKNILDRLSKSTVLPSQVSVSISSFDDELNLDNYPFELIITKTPEFKNTAQNCNIAASKLSTDIISFFGGDDILHSKRNEYIIKAFELGSVAVVHNFIRANKEMEDFIDDIGDLDLYIDYVDEYVSDLHFPISSKDRYIAYANGPISVSKEIFDKFKYNESESYFKTEDSVYNSEIVKNGYKISYIKNNLMIYIQ